MGARGGMSIKSRLAWAFSAMAGLCLILGGILVGAFHLLSARYILYEHERRLLDAVTETHDAFESQRKSLDGYLLGLDSEKDRFLSLESEIAQIQTQWRRSADRPEERQEQAKMEARLTSFRSDANRVLKLVDRGSRAAAIEFMESAISPSYDAIEHDLKILVFEKKRNADEAWLSARRLAARVTRFSVLLLLAVLLAAVGFATLIYQSVTQPLLQLIEGTKRIAQGQWNLKLDIVGPRELCELAQSFESMGKSLGDLQAQVLQMDRMSAVGTLAGGVAHEINNPLTGVLGQAQLLLSTLSPDDPRRPNLEKIERAAKRCKKIVRGLLDFSRPQDYAFQPVEVEGVVESVLALCETEIEALGIRVVWQRNASLPKAWASENHLQQVFLNLLTNAMHAMPKGGTLTIAAEETGPYRLPEATLEGEPAVRKYVQIHFADTGIGIAPENLARVFDPFFTTKDPGKGTGLGLSISYGIMGKHRGAIEVQSDGVGRGSTFTVRIPVSPLPVDLEPPAGAQAGEGEGPLASPLEF